MAKNNMLKRYKEEDDDFDFSEMMDSCGDEEMIGFVQGILEASNNHMTLALELTKLVVAKSAATNMKEEEVFSVFKKSLGIISESFPLKKIWEKFSTND